MIEIISVGKNKDQHISVLENHYLKQSKNIKVTELKSYGDKHQDKEMQEISKYISSFQNSSIFLMTENGRQYNSKEFSTFIESRPNLKLIIGGASGFSDQFKNAYPNQLSLSKMTFPHKIARVLLIEQLYRAQCITKGHPYHK